MSSSPIFSVVGLLPVESKVFQINVYLVKPLLVSHYLTSNISTSTTTKWCSLPLVTNQFLELTLRKTSVLWCLAIAFSKLLNMGQRTSFFSSYLMIGQKLVGVIQIARINLRWSGVVPWVVSFVLWNLGLIFKISWITQIFKTWVGTISRTFGGQKGLFLCKYYIISLRLCLIWRWSFQVETYPIANKH